METLSPVAVKIAIFVFVLSSVSLVVVLYLLPVDFSNNDEQSQEPPRYQILVLGDIGRSPRMQYHAISLGKHEKAVDLIGYLGMSAKEAGANSELHPDIFAHPSITVHPLPRAPPYLQTDNRLLFLALAPVKVIFQTYGLLLVLGCRIKPAKVLLVQNPPSIPTLVVAQIICYLRDTQLFIDWHNFGYSVLALKFGESHPLVRISQWYETIFSHYAAAHLVVSDAMAQALKRDFRIDAPILVLHDRPASHFRPFELHERLAFLGRLPETAPFVDEIERMRLRVIVSSTSWTMDEDFSLLLEALVGYSELATTSHPYLPEVMVIITGKGPQKEHYLAKIADMEDKDKLEMVTIKTAWLSTKDYASLLASADVGISLHKSTSGVDLPMKVVDMFGAGLPVVGWGEFQAWPELVHEGINGRGFASTEELQTIIVELFGNDAQQLQRLRSGARMESERGWDAEWDSVAGRLFGIT
ncbi:mannosyltransferase [Xylographa trunciseda]|nr:mannosyltransferase [Xylographa trunciseda]